MPRDYPIGRERQPRAGTWFSVLTRQAIRRGTFGSVEELIAMIEAFTHDWNAGATPFPWDQDRR